MIVEQDAGFERALRAAFQETLVAYCDRAPGPVPIRVTIRTARPISLPHSEFEIVARWLVEARLGSTGPGRPALMFTVDTALTDPWFRIIVHNDPPTPASEPARIPAARTAPTEPVPTDRMSMRTATATTMKATRPDTGPWPADSVIPHRSTPTLILAYGRRLRWEYPLVDSMQWIPVRRGPGKGTDVEVALPTDLAAVPRGALMHLRYWNHDASLLRTRSRPEYTVYLDGDVLVPGRPCGLAHRGSITFTYDQREPTVLDYLLVVPTQP